MAITVRQSGSGSGASIVLSEAPANGNVLCIQISATVNVGQIADSTSATLNERQTQTSDPAEVGYTFDYQVTGSPTATYTATGTGPFSWAYVELAGAQYPADSVSGNSTASLGSTIFSVGATTTNGDLQFAAFSSSAQLASSTNAFSNNNAGNTSIVNTNTFIAAYAFATSTASSSWTVTVGTQAVGGLVLWAAYKATVTVPTLSAFLDQPSTYAQQRRQNATAALVGPMQGPVAPIIPVSGFLDAVQPAPRRSFIVEPMGPPTLRPPFSGFIDVTVLQRRTTLRVEPMGPPPPLVPFSGVIEQPPPPKRRYVVTEFAAPPYLPPPAIPTAFGFIDVMPVAPRRAPLVESWTPEWATVPPPLPPNAVYLTLPISASASLTLPITPSASFTLPPP